MMYVIWLVSILGAALLAVGLSQKVLQTLSELSEFEFDTNDRLRYQYFSFVGGEPCASLIEELNFQMRQPVHVMGNLSVLLFPDNQHVACQYMCMERGTHKDHVMYPLRKHYYYSDETQEDEIGSLTDWYNENCERQEIGFILYGTHDATIYWINPQNKRVDVGTLGRGEQHTVWKETYLGHQFQVVQHGSNKILGAYIVEYSGIFVIGHPDPLPPMDPHDIRRSIEETLFHEWDRSHQVKRTFTEFGFNKGKLPLDLFSSMSTYHFNNRNHMFLEEWETNDIFVNWWESKCFMILMPWGLKKYWQESLKKLVEEWTGEVLELTDIYGMRRYEDGARLLSHVDRVETHAASLIINVAQGGIRRPWKVEIYDHADRLHVVEMVPGDIVYYESARCMHGRMQPLEGSFYVNVFAHYRPIGDPKWYLKSNPTYHQVSPVLDEIHCIDVSPFHATTEESDVSISGDASFSSLSSPSDPPPRMCYVEGDSSVSSEHVMVHVPFLSRSNERLVGPESLFEYWKKVSPMESTE